MSRRPVFIGELNPYGGDPHYALIDYPAGCAGERMRRLVCGLSSDRHVALPRYNLCRGKWSIAAARAEAIRIARFHPDDVVVLLGRKVASAFGVGALDPFMLFDVEPPRVARFPAPLMRTVLLPHPSGLCRLWHVSGAFTRARSLLAEACPDVPWGEVPS